MTASAHQITAVAIAGRALLIDGAPGSGKSSLALGLIDRGAVLIGDDSVMLEMRDDALVVSPHPNTEGLLEVRNLGVLPFRVCPEAPASLVIRLETRAPRFIDAADNTELLGVRLPLILIDAASVNLAVKAELALNLFGIAHHAVPSKDAG